MDKKTEEAANGIMNHMAAGVEKFNREIIGLPIPNEPSLLTPERHKFRTGHLSEEMVELLKDHEAGDIDGVADALIDLIYVALGYLVEMGLTPQPLFDEVQAANMRKQRGEQSKRPGSLGYDAVKPEGWTGPDFADYLKLTTDDVRVILDAKREVARRPKVLILGHARHGKDTACEFLRDHYGLKFTSSSQFCADRVVYPQLKERYASPEECFADRHNNRALWFDLITAYNTPDKARLGREIFAEFDIYCGLRNIDEFAALKLEGIVDAVVWVDASGRLPPEGADSCTVQKELADYVVSNNGTLEEFKTNMTALMNHILIEKTIKKAFAR